MLRIVISLLIAVVCTAHAWRAPATRAHEAQAAQQACTNAQKAKRSKALSAYKKVMPKQRKAYFKRVKSVKKRKAFAKGQQAKLRALELTLAACVSRPRSPVPPPRPPTPPPVPPQPGPPQPSPPPPSPLTGADLSLTVTDAIDPLTQWNRQTYTLTVTNNGPLAGFNVTLTDALPPELRLLSVTSSRGGCSRGPAVSCNLGGFAPGETASVTIHARIRAAGSVSYSATIASTTADPTPSNNTATATTTVSPSPGLPSASTGPACSPGLARGPIVHVGHASTYTEGATDYSVFIRPSGTVRALMLFVDFSDAPAAESTVALYQQIVPEAAQWFHDMSGRTIALDVGARHEWLRMPKPSTTYGLATGNYNQQYVRDAISAADAQTNFGGVDLVYIIPSGGAAIDRAQSPYAFGNTGLQTGEGELRHVSYFGPAYRTPIVIVHETLHHLGLPDLYDFEGEAFRHIGGWDVMSNQDGGGGLLAWHKWKLGWIGATQLRCLNSPGTLEDTISPVSIAGGVKAIVVPTGPSTAYVVEAREQLGRDAGLCDYGVLVYSVDATVWSGSGPIRLRPAQTSSSPVCGVLANAAYDLAPGEVSTFEDASVRVEVLIASEAGYRVRVTRK